MELERERGLERGLELARERVEPVALVVLAPAGDCQKSLGDELVRGCQDGGRGVVARNRETL